MISRLPEKSVPDWLAKISQSTITIDPFPLTQLLEDSLYYPSSGFDRDPVKYLSGNILSFIYVDYGRSHDEFENEIIKRGFHGYECVATRSVTEQELTPIGWKPRPLTNIEYEELDLQACFELGTGAISNGSGDGLPVLFGECYDFPQ